MSINILEYDIFPGVKAFSTMRGSELPYPVVQPHQTHSLNVAIVTDPNTTREDLEAIDALITNVPGLAIGVRTADCIPVLLYDRRKKVAAAIHAGWRGTVGRISQITIKKMTDTFGTDPKDIYAQIGPGIGLQSFQVGEEVVQQFSDASFPMDRIYHHLGDKVDGDMSTGDHLDLWEANKFILEESGVPSDNIRTAGFCTYQRNDLFYSARRETIKCGRIISSVMIDPRSIWEQMLSGEEYDAADQSLLDDLFRTREKVRDYNDLRPTDDKAKDELLSSLLGKRGQKCIINQPFYCDYGVNIEVGENFFANYNFTVLDEAKVKIGDNAFIASNVSIYTAGHPLDVKKRNALIQYAKKVTIGDNVWIGGDVTIVPGVTIGNNVTIGAGSVVTKDVPDNVLVAGIPARIIKTISQ